MSNQKSRPRTEKTTPSFQLVVNSSKGFRGILAGGIGNKKTTLTGRGGRWWLRGQSKLQGDFFRWFHRETTGNGRKGEGAGSQKSK